MQKSSTSYGGKGDSLIKLKELGFPVPKFEIIPFQVFKEAKASDFKEIPHSFKTPLFTLSREFENIAVAVRSSASKEDGSHFSFAGLFETFLDVRGAEEIEASVLKCWQSTHTERTKKYCERNNLEVDELEMAVVIQEYIEPDFAGVLFSVNPITGDDREMIIEACPGSGEKLVSGQISPSRFLLNRDDNNFITASDDRLKISPDPKILKELQMLALSIQAKYGVPLDIEFAVKKDKVYILQSRPITKIQFSKSMGEWTTSDFRDGGVSSAVVSPVMWSLYEKIFASSLPNYFVKLKLITLAEASSIVWYKVFYGRPYWNLRAVKNIQETLPGYNERNFDEDMALPINYEGSGVTTGLSLRGILKALPVLGALHKEYLAQKERSLDLLKQFVAIEDKHLAQDLTSMTDVELYKSFQKLILQEFDYVESEYFQTIYNASNAKLEFSDELKFYKKIDPSLELVNLLSDLGNLKVTGPAHFLTRLSANLKAQVPDAQNVLDHILDGIKRNIKLSDLTANSLLHGEMSEFVKLYYFHSERELDLLIPRWGEDLRFALETLRSLLSVPLKEHKPAENNKKGSIFESELDKLKRAHQSSYKRFIPGAWASVETKLNRIREYLWLREEVRDRSTRVYYFIRKYLLEMGLRLKINELIFYLSYQDLFQFINQEITHADLVKRAESSKLYALGFKNFKNSNEIGFRFNQSSWKAKSTTTNGKTSYFGIGCSAGVIVGKSCVIKDINEAGKLKAGEIMVVPFTDPGWTPLFSLAAGVVTETGGLLSHAALISREYGIPCVLNVNGATEQIPDQKEIEIDGNAGRVSIL